MVKDFKKEIMSIERADLVREKLMTLAVYNEIYNTINAGTIDIFMDYYGPMLESSFVLAASFATVQDLHEYDTRGFLNLFWPLMEKSNLSHRTPVKEMIEYFKSDLNIIMNNMPFVPVIDSYSQLDLETKMAILVQFREFLNDSFEVSVTSLKEDEGEKLRADLVVLLTQRLDEYLARGQNSKEDLVNNLRPFLVASTKEYLFKRLEEGTLGYYMYPDEIAKVFCDALNPLEQKVWLLSLVYGLSCAEYTQTDGPWERIKEISNFLGISRLRYFSLTVSLSNKLGDIYQREVEKMNYGDEDPGQGRH